MEDDDEALGELLGIGRVKDEAIDSVAALIQILATFERRHIAQWTYRGHSRKNYRLVPSLFRLQKEKEESFSDWCNLEEFLLDSFKREAVQFLRQVPEDHFDWLVLAQHHKLPTRLLDWTTNPLIATYFAVENNLGEDGDLWCMGYPSTNNCHSEGSRYSQRKVLLDENFLLFPKHLDNRVVNQSGCFTMHADEKPLNENAEMSELLAFVRIRIPCSQKRTILSQLYDLGIHASFIYPGLDTISERLKYELSDHVFRHTNLDLNDTESSKGCKS